MVIQRMFLNVKKNSKKEVIWGSETFELQEHTALIESAIKSTTTGRELQAQCLKLGWVL